MSVVWKCRIVEVKIRSRSSRPLLSSPRPYHFSHLSFPPFLLPDFSFLNLLLFLLLVLVLPSLFLALSSHLFCFSSIPTSNLLFLSFSSSILNVPGVKIAEFQLIYTVDLFDTFSKRTRGNMRRIPFACLLVSAGVDVTVYF